MLFGDGRLVRTVPKGLGGVLLPFLLFRRREATVRAATFRAMFIITPVGSVRPTAKTIKGGVATLL